MRSLSLDLFPLFFTKDKPLSIQQFDFLIYRRPRILHLRLLKSHDKGRGGYGSGGGEKGGGDTEQQGSLRRKRVGGSTLRSSVHRQFQAANRRQAGMEAMLVEREAASTDMVATVEAASILAVRGYSSGAMVPV
ncbi:hypothetical protein RHMOL_Rhmol02G0145400 [Rhododendron molle]|uniref:Uncharacterized protein n=1 Tax=Rhododendron molle TaxID=49168 RepID=A0ACC0PRQ3_RHOML|nr:hypothetical protein RHMOL_Rhmol02G0145400 [Rhododendron molle]